MVKPMAAQPSRSASSTLAVTAGQGSEPLYRAVVVVDLQDQRDLAGELGRAGLDEAERRGVGVAAGVDGELEVVARVVAGGVGREAARRAVLEALVDRQDHHLARAGEATRD